MFVVGLTGGIGSGKTAASNAFARLGVEIVDADVVAREVVARGTPALAAIAAHFGPRILLADGSLDRAQLRQRIFSQPEDKRWLEALLHPLIGQETQRQLKNARSPYVIYVSPLLVEGGHQSFCDRLVVVDVPEALQLSRTMARDSNDQEQVQRIVASQADRQTRLAVASDVIDNIGDLTQLEAQVATLHAKFTQLAEQSP